MRGGRRPLLSPGDDVGVAGRGGTDDGAGADGVGAAGVFDAGCLRS